MDKLFSLIDETPSQQNKREILKILHDTPDIVNSVDGSNHTVLTMACVNSREDIALEILKLNPTNVSETDDDGCDALMYSCFNNLPKAAERILATNPLLTNINVNGQTALIIACNQRLDHIVELILSQGNCLPKHQDTTRLSALLIACKSNQSSIALKILKYDPSTSDAVDIRMNNAFYYACIHEIEVVVVELLNILAKTPGLFSIVHPNDAGETPLIVAYEHNKKQNIVNALLAYEDSHIGSINIGHSDSLNKSILHYACINDDKALVTKLIAYENKYPDSILLGQPDNIGKTPLIYSCINDNDNDRDIAKMLISTKKSNIGQCDGTNCTALIHAIIGEHVGVILLLIQSGQSNPSIVESKHHRTALMYACIKKFDDVANALIDTRDCNIGYVSRFDQKSALIWACQKKMNAVAIRIIDGFKENLTQTDYQDETAISYATKNNMVDVLARLHDEIFTSELSQSYTDYTKLHIVFYIKNVANIPLQLHIPEILDRNKVLDIDAFKTSINTFGFCKRPAYNIGDYAASSAKNRTHLTILITIFPNIIVGFATVIIKPTHIELEAICGDSTFKNVSNVSLGVAEQLCVLLGLDTIKLEAVPDAVVPYEKQGFVQDPGSVTPGDLVPMTKIGNFTHIIPTHMFNQPIPGIIRRASGYNTGRSPVIPGATVASIVASIVAAPVVASAPPMTLDMQIKFEKKEKAKRLTEAQRLSNIISNTMAGLHGITLIPSGVSSTSQTQKSKPKSKLKLTSTKKLKSTSTKKLKSDFKLGPKLSPILEADSESDSKLGPILEADSESDYLYVADSKV